MKQTIITTLLALVALTVQAQGPLLKTHVETGDLEGVLDGTVAELVLRREPGNEHDKMAICVETPDGKKLGYVPEGENKILARLMECYKQAILFKQFKKDRAYTRHASKKLLGVVVLSQTIN